MLPLFRKSLFFVAGVFLLSCASHPKHADISPSSVPMDEIAALESDIKASYGRQADLLSYAEMQAAQGSLSNAKKSLAKEKKREDILNEIAEGREYLKKAEAQAATRGNPIQGVLAARQSAIVAGARTFPPTAAKLSALDTELRSDVAESNRWEASKVSDNQNKYLQIELAAITATQLGKAAANIDTAKSNKAASRTPHTLNRAEIEYHTAENLIASNRNEEAHYRDAVAKANSNAEYLNSVVNAVKKSNDRLDETSAIKLVNSERKVSQLQNELGTAAETTEKLTQERSDQAEAFTLQGQKLKAAGELVNLQASIETARTKFAPGEADVFQQGNNLLIRLKSIKFRSGGTELPSEALPLLAKVREVASGLDPKAMSVEGHTDSVGSSEINKTLSEGRARSVANYFGNNGIKATLIETSGFGFEKPIASNKTKEGRSQNRRVDIIVTPGDAPAAGIKE